MDSNFGLYVIDKSGFAVLSVTDANGDPYSIPLSVVRNGNNLYFHSAKAGMKVDLFQNEPQVRLAFVCDVQIPDNHTHEQLLALKEDGKAAEITSKVFTTEFASAMVDGTITVVTDENEKQEALRLICEKYTPDKMFLFDTAIASGMKLTNVYRISIENITAKTDGID